MTRRALITGASRGLGLEFVRQCLERGQQVFACARNPQASEGLQALGRTYGKRLVMVSMDVTDPDSVERAHGQIASMVDGLELLVNNAGINSSGVPQGQRNTTFGELEPAGILHMVHVNAVAPILIAQRFVSLLENGRDPKIINVSSWLGSLGKKMRGGNYGYCTSKTALNMMARAMALDLLPKGIISVCFNPGWVQTDMGGPKASLTPAQSVGGMLSVTRTLEPEDAGRFIQWDGTEHPW